MDSKHTCILRHEGDAMMFAESLCTCVLCASQEGKERQTHPKLYCSRWGSRTLGLPHFL